jgi:hypothetical protein
MNKDVWNRVDSVLRVRHRTWTSLAKELGYSDQRVSNWRRRGIPAQAFASLSTHLNVSVQWLITGDGLPGTDNSSVKNHTSFLSENSLSEEEKILLVLWRGLTKDQKTKHLEDLRGTKRANDAILQELSAAQEQVENLLRQTS